MKILEVPIYDDEGGIKFTQYVSPEEAQHLLQFAINFLAATGSNVQMMIAKGEEPEVKFNKEFDD